MAIPPSKAATYNQSLAAVYGVFGAGGGLQAFYIQATITPADLDNISLISEIPGSEKWRIRDLFQRDVDNDRVTHGLLPYIQRPDRIKFFNPLTLTVLPMDEDGYTTLKQMPRIVEDSLTEDDLEWSTLERTGFFRIRWLDDAEAYARLEWSDKRARLVAIDGQHRLSALKRFQRDEASQGHRDFLSWRIPVVIVSFRTVGKAKSPTVLDVVRNVFIYINTEARTVNESRAILLSDESINAVCTQELIQHSHDNDTKRRPVTSTVPLLFYDWRGEERAGRPVDAPVSIKTVKEIHNWFATYILNDDFQDEQKVALKVVPDNPLNGAYADRKLTYDYSQLARDQFKAVLLPAITHLLENFTPYQNYIADLRRLERQCLRRGDIGSYAISQLRFGSSLAPDPIRPQVNAMVQDFEQRVAEFKKAQIGDLLLDDVGMRGIVSGFGTLFRSLGPPENWLDYATWFTAAINSAFEAGWFDKDGRLAKPHLRHVAVDQNGYTINYRLDHAPAALGAYVEMLVLTYGDLDAWGNIDLDPVRDNALSRLRSTLLRGYKKEVRLILREKDEFRDGGRPLTRAVEKEAQKRVNRRIRRFEQKLDDLTPP